MLLASLTLLLLPMGADDAGNAKCIDTRRLVALNATEADPQRIEHSREDARLNRSGEIGRLRIAYKRASDGGVIYLFEIPGVRDQEAGYFFDASGALVKRQTISPFSRNADRSDCET